MINEAKKHFGGEDILINNAGVTFQSSIENFPDKELDDTIDLNLKSYFRTTMLVLPCMRKKNWGRADVPRGQCAEINYSLS